MEENEMEYGDEDFPEGSIPYIENEDELVYPLQSEDWMGESFDLKEYGIDYGMSGSEADLHGYGISDEYEDMQRAIDFNISNFDETLDNLVEDSNLITESFKTISNGTPTQSKITDKEHESWSTADADSIEEDLSEHDNVISKIDELLAEDFAFDHTDYYKDEENNNFVRNEETQSISPLDSFKVVDEEVGIKTDSCTLYGKENFGKSKSLEEVEKDTISDIPSKLLSDKLSSNDTVSKNSTGDAMSAEISIEQSETIVPEILPEVSVSKSNSYMSSQLSDTFSSKKSEFSSEIEPCQVDLKISAGIESSSRMVYDQYGALTVNKSSETASNATTVTDSTVTVSSEIRESFVVKKPCKDTTESVQADDSNSKAILEQSKSFVVKKPFVTLSESVQVEDSNSKTVSEQSGPVQVENSNSKSLLEEDHSFVAKKSSEVYTGSVQVDNSNSQTILKQPEAFDEKKLSRTLTGLDQVEDTNSILEQAESFAAKKPTEPAIGSVKVYTTNSKPISEQSESFTVKKASQDLSETIQIVESECKTSKVSDSLTAAKKSSIVSASDTNTLSGDEGGNKIKLSGTENFNEKHKSLSNDSKPKSEKISKTDAVTSPIQDISLKKDVSESEVESSVALPKTKQVLTTEKENQMLDVKNNTEYRQSSAEVSTTPVVHPVIKDESNETKSNIPFETKLQKEKASEQLSIKTEEVTASTEITDTTVRRRVRKSSAQLEKESEDTKPDIPLKRRRDSRKTSISSPGDLNTSASSDTSEENKTKPDIPEKRRRRPKSEAEPDTTAKPNIELPSLPPKTIRRDSSTDSISSSVFSSASSESLSCYESASLKDSSKSETAAVIEAGPEVPARRLSVRQRRRESSEDTSSSSINRSSSSRRSYDLPPKESMDLCRKRTSIDERMVKLQAAGKCTTKETAFIAAKLLEMQFDEEDALLASRQCSSIYHAVKFLTQLCELCQCRFPINLMASMIHCAHRACKECLKAHFTTQIYDRSIFTLLCPICQKPDITDQNIQEYFNHLEIMFRDILDSNVYDLFQRKLRDEVLTKDPNFHWCSQCSSGFIASPRLKKLYCPDCSAITCASCHQTWELEHEGVHCERFQQWKDMHTPEPPPAGLVKFLTDRGITCPSCDINYAQACGGCMMYKCSHCSYEFCGFCSQPCKRGKDCGNKQCELRGIHVHHPFTCLFYIRDKDISELQMLLDEESVKYLTIPPKDQIVKSRCQVREQKHFHGSITEDRCGRDIVPYCAGLCRTHYYEYLAELLKKNKINPLPLMTTQDLQFMLRKSRCPVPEKVKGESNEEFYERLTQMVSSTLT